MFNTNIFLTKYHRLSNNWFLVALALMLLTVLKGIRFPNIWSYSHFLFNYEYGFIKRGLVGAFFEIFNNPIFLSYEFFFYFSSVIFVLNMVLIASLVFHLMVSKNMVLVGCGLVFVSSIAIVYLSHFIGYFDQIGLLATLVLLKLNSFRIQVIFTILVFPIILLIHEASLVLFFPILFMSLLFKACSTNRNIRLTVLAISSLVLLTMTVFISNSQLEKNEATELYSRAQSESNVQLRKDAFYVLHRSMEDNTKIMNKMWQKKQRTNSFIDTCFVTLPISILFIIISFRVLQQANVPLGIRLLAVLASNSPLTMHFFAWDMERWNTLAITSSFLILYTVYQHYPLATVGRLRTTIPILIFILAFSTMSKVPLFDGYYVKQFPFTEHRIYLQELIDGHQTFPSIPNR